jgi:hypothetical protein
MIDTSISVVGSAGAGALEYGIARATGAAMNTIRSGRILTPAAMNGLRGQGMFAGRGALRAQSVSPNDAVHLVTGAAEGDFGALNQPSKVINEFGVSFFDKAIAIKFYTPSITGKAPLMGVPGKASFHMLVDDAQNIISPVSAAAETGFAPSVVNAWKEGKDVYGLAFPTKNICQEFQINQMQVGGYTSFLVVILP